MPDVQPLTSTRDNRISRTSDPQMHELRSKSILRLISTPQDSFMTTAALSALSGVQQDDGGPFGAVVVLDSSIVSVAHNTVVKNRDPSCHAEMNAIRVAQKHLNSDDLSQCTLYTSAEPCPMCWAAARLAKIKTVYIGVDAGTAADFGFDDRVFYEQLSLPREKRLVPTVLLDDQKTICEHVVTMIRDKNNSLPRTSEVLINQTLIDYGSSFKSKFILAALTDAVEAQRACKDSQSIPNGCVIVKDDQIVSKSSDFVSGAQDVTSTAEIRAIRSAGKKLNSFDLTGCHLFCIAEPNVMSAACCLWARLESISFVLSAEDMARLGFNETELLATDFVNRLGSNSYSTIQSGVCCDVFREWQRLGRVLY